MKNIYRKIVFILILFSFVINVDALSSFPSTITTQSEGVSLTLNSSLQLITTASAGDELFYPYFHVKNSNNGNIICVSGLGVNEPSSGITCSTSNWASANQAKGVAYIINTIIGNGGSSTVSNEKYYWSEILVNDYLGTYTPGIDSYISVNIINAGVKIAGTGKTYNEILSGAESYASASYDVSLSASSTDLSFTPNSDGYHYSNAITITSTSTPTLELSNNKFSYDVNNGKYTFKIKSSDIAIGGSESLTVTIKNSGNSYYTAQRYNCGENIQNVALTQTVQQTVSGKEIKLTGTVNRPGNEIKIGKVNSDGEFLSGAKLTLKTESGTVVKDITTTSGFTSISNLTPGTYSLTETKAPAGYKTITDAITIVIDDNGTITSSHGSVTISGNEIKIKNELTQTKIVKADSISGSRLAGAKFELLDADKKSMPCILQNGAKGTKQNLDKCEWTTIVDLAYVYGLVEGEYYYLHEVSAPPGYYKIKDVTDNPAKMKISVGKLTQLTLKNSLIETEISKVDATTGKELPGATLQILDKDSKKISCIILDEDGSRKNLSDCSWVSGDKPVTVLGLPAGKYYLVETIVPDGYVLKSEKVSFEVKADGAVNKVKMENELTRVVINKVNSVDNKLLPGATLEIQDKDGNIVKYCKDEEGNSVECKWVSSEDAYEIFGMPKGTYYLVETLAPEGYHLNTEKVEFIVDGKTPVIEVEMINELEVEVPDTLSSRSALLLAIAMFDIALGIGIITYVKKNKLKEQ